MRNKILYLYTENLNFFYRLNKELNRRNIHFKILSRTSKIPDIHSILLTTSEDIQNLKISYKKVKFIVYDEKDSFNHFIYKILAAYRITFKEFYSHLVFSIDPGSKKIGLVVFLDDYYFGSHTFFDKLEIITIIKDYITCFQTNNPNLLKLIFKFGSGVLPLVVDLIKAIKMSFSSRNNLKFFLIDESKSSKIKIQGIKKKFKTKHELSALIIGLRDGLEVNQLDNMEKYKQKKVHESNNCYELVNGVLNDSVNLKKIIDKLLSNEISLSESSEIFR